MKSRTASRSALDALSLSLTAKQNCLRPVCCRRRWLASAAVILFLTFVMPDVASAQDLDVDDVSPQIWADYNPEIQLKSRLQLYGDAGVRTELKESGWWRLVLRPGVRYTVNDRIWIAGGVGNFITFNDLFENRWELRFFQGVALDWPKEKFPLQHYVRLEQRFDFNTETWESLNELRLRYRIRYSHDWDAIREDRYWRFLAGFEAFADLAGQDGQIDDIARATVAIERSFARELRVRLDGTWQKSGLFFISDAQIDEIYVRLRVYQSWFP